MDKTTGQMAGQTAGQLADKLGLSADAMRKRFVRTYPGRAFSMSVILSAEDVQALSGRKNKKQDKTEATPIVTKPGPAHQKPAPAKKERWRINTAKATSAATSIVLLAVVLCHASLVWYDCSTLWGMAGTIGGGAVTLIVIAAVLLAADRERYYTSEGAMWFVALVDIAAWWVHFPVFRTPLVNDTTTGFLCGFLCACSFMALYLFRSKNIEQ